MTRTIARQVLCLSLTLLLASAAHAASVSSAWSSSAGRSQDYRNPRFLLELVEATSVELRLSSATGDSYLYLLSSSGSVLAENDNGGGGSNSALSVNLAAGKYQLVAASTASGTVGDFTLEASAGVLSRCFVGYKDSNYRGSSTLFCSPGGSFYNDAYSSLRVPKGMQVRGYEHGNRTGVARTYYTDTPSLGDLMNDKISAFTWGEFADQDFFVVTASDPTLIRTHCEDGGWSDECAAEQAAFAGASSASISQTYGLNLVQAINQVNEHLGASRSAGVVINGDLTVTGDQNGDLDDYIDIFEGGLESNVYVGLGDRDYDDNVGTCSENDCASDMVRYHAKIVPSLNPISFDYSASGTYYKFPSLRKDYKGSLAYSWEVGDVHFVQLNNRPSYSRKWNGWDFDDARRDYFEIRSSLSWLRSDLAAATAAGKEIVLNLHDWSTDRYNVELQAILNEFPVSVVYAGDWYRYSGLAENMPLADGSSMPVMISGSARKGTFLVTRVANGKIYVWTMIVDHFDGGALKVKYNNHDHEVSDLAAVFAVCDEGCERFYQYEYTLR